MTKSVASTFSIYSRHLGVTPSSTATAGISNDHRKMQAQFASVRCVQRRYVWPINASMVNAYADMDFVEGCWRYKNEAISSRNRFASFLATALLMPRRPERMSETRGGLAIPTRSFCLSPCKSSKRRSTSRGSPRNVALRRACSQALIRSRTISVSSDSGPFTRPSSQPVSLSISSAIRDIAVHSG